MLKISQVRILIKCLHVMQVIRFTLSPENACQWYNNWEVGMTVRHVGSIKMHLIVCNGNIWILMWVYENFNMICSENFQTHQHALLVPDRTKWNSDFISAQSTFASLFITVAFKADFYCLHIKYNIYFSEV